MSQREYPGRDKTPCGLRASEVPLNAKQKASHNLAIFTSPELPPLYHGSWAK